MYPSCKCEVTPVIFAGIVESLINVSGSLASTSVAMERGKIFFIRTSENCLQCIALENRLRTY